MISKRKFFLLFSLIICFFTCSRRLPPSNSDINYISESTGKKCKKFKSKNYVEIIKQPCIYSKKEWCKLANSKKNLSFVELQIDDFGSQKEKVNKKNIDYPNTIKVLEIHFNKNSKRIKIKKRNNLKASKKELTVLFIHGLGGKEGDYYSLIRKLAKENFNGRVNLISGKRFDSCIKTIEEQTKEVEKKLIEYLSMYSKKTTHEILIVGHSQGGIISLSLLKKLLKKQKIKVGGLILIGTPLKGIDSTKKFMDEQRKSFPHIISAIEKSIFGCTLKKNPKGVLQTTNKYLIPLIAEANELIRRYAIPTRVVIGTKPANIEYPNSPLSFLKKLFRLMNHNILNIGSMKKEISASKIGNTFKELMKGIPKMKKLFNAQKLTGAKESDFLLSKATQTWDFDNPYVKNIELKGIVHNWKISLLVSRNAKNRIATELESPRTASIVKKMINRILNK